MFFIDFCFYYFLFIWILRRFPFPWFCYTCETCNKFFSPLEGFFHVPSPLALETHWSFVTSFDRGKHFSYWISFHTFYGHEIIFFFRFTHRVANSIFDWFHFEYFILPPFSRSINIWWKGDVRRFHYPQCNLLISWFMTPNTTLDDEPANCRSWS